VTDRMRTLAGKACGFLATLWVITSVGAQSPARGGPQTPTFHSQVDVVEVDVVAVDSAGYPVHGLTAADFTFLDRKQPQKIVNFSEVSHQPEGEPTPATTVKRDVASNQTAQAERLVVMVIDDLHLFAGRVAKVQELARTFVEDLGSQATMSVLFTSGEHSIELTEDRAELLNAIAALKGRQITPRPGTQTAPGGFEFFNDLISTHSKRSKTRPTC
jgi:VWFA-related protein